MKKQAKIITLVISLALIACCAIGFSVSADATEPDVSIESYNVAFGGELHLFYAVNTSKVGDGASKIGIELSFDPIATEGREVFEATSSSEKYTPNPDYPTFYSFGIPAKNLNDVIYARPYVEYEGGDKVYGDEVAYSVLEYCYEMVLVKADKSGATATKIKNMKATLRSLLTYGENAQKLFEHETDALPSDYFYIAVEGGTVNGESLIFAHESELSDGLTFARTGDIPEGKIFVGWDLTYFNGDNEEIAADGDNLSVSNASVKAAPIYYDDTKATTFETLDPNAANVVNTNNTTDGSFIFNAAAKDPVTAANKCLKATVWLNAYSSATASTTVVSNGDYVSGATLDGNAFHFETDLYISSDMPNSTSTASPTGTVLQITFLNGANSNLGSYTLYINNKNGEFAEPVIRISQNFGSKTSIINAINNDGTGGIGFDEWFNVDFTLYADADGNTGYLITVSTADGRSYQYFDTQVATTYSSNIAANSAVETTKVTWYKTSTHRDVYLDNILCETLEGETYTPAQ